MTSVAVIFKGDESRTAHYYDVRDTEAEIFADEEFLYVGDQLVISKGSVDLVYVTDAGAPMLILPEYHNSTVNVYSNVPGVVDDIAKTVEDYQGKLW